MSIELSIIAGLMFGVEYVIDPEEDDVQYVVVDFAFVRLLFSW